jgi:hypothetical protein
MTARLADFIAARILRVSEKDAANAATAVWLATSPAA